MKQPLKRMGIIFLILSPSLFVLHSIAWADILVWKTGYVAVICGIPVTVFFWPLTLIPVKPGSSIDGPYLWMPLVFFLLMGWSWLISLLIQRLKHK
ncbi:MAG: hypothetical protein HZC54_07330 [Verrucomicrobia bacterium]|nr:hypothetical protein [Verrucomicrobiota bacterium]